MLFSRNQTAIMFGGLGVAFCALLWWIGTIAQQLNHDAIAEHHRGVVAEENTIVNVNDGRTIKLAEAPALPPPPKETKVHHVNTASDLKDHWGQFSIFGSIFRDDKRELQRGEMVYGDPAEVLKLLDGNVWFADLEPNGDRSPLKTRLLYAVHVSNDLSKGCGEAIADFAPSPKKCVVSESIYTWKQFRKTFEGKLKVGPEEWDGLYVFLREREWK